MIFDVLYVKGMKDEELNLLKNLKIEDRKKVLQKIVKPLKN